MQIDLLILNAAQIVTCAGNGAPLRGASMRDSGIITDGAIAIHEGMIVGLGKADDLHAHYTANQIIDAQLKAIVPGFVDPHTHVVYAGDRIDEFEMRIQGTTYQEIMARGGGINNSVRSVRAASMETIIAQTRTRLDAMLKLGTTTAEVKSGYGLDTASELKLLNAIAALDQSHVIDLIPTFMGAHAIPPEYAGRSEAYVQMVLEAMLPAVSDWYQISHFATRNIPLFIDVFCEQNAFTLEQARRVLAAGKAAGMQVKAHVDEFNALGGVQMALDLEAVSVDHLDVTPSEDFQRLAQSNTIAVIIPAVNFNLGSTHFADARGLIDAGAIIALTTDINPGSAPCPSMPLVMAIACRYQKLLPAEALIASTINAAYAVGMGDRIGSLEVGKQADLLILSTPDYRHLAYQFGGNLVETVIKRGVVI